MRHKVSSASLRGAPVNWTSWPAPSTSILDAPIRSARSSRMASKPALWPPETTSFGKEAAARSARARSVYQQLAAWLPTGLHATRPPKPRARVSCGETPAPTTGPARGAASPAAPSCSSLRRTAGSHTCDSRTCPASHPSPPSAGSPPSRRRRSRPTRSGRSQHVVSRGARGHTVRALARAAA